MALSQRARKFWSIVVLVVGLPIWIIIAVNLADLINRESILVELVVFVVLGFVWILPFKKLFSGVSAMTEEEKKKP